MAKRLIFCAFTMNTVSHIYHGLWRHPQTRLLEDTDLDTWVDLARLLERGRFDAIFLADIIGLYGDYRRGWETYVREGLQIPSNDPSVLISALAHVTEPPRARVHQLDNTGASLQFRTPGLDP